MNQIIKIDFPASQYFAEEFPKSQIYLHHTAGNPSGIGCANWWKSNEIRVATAFVITGNVKNSKVEKDGDIIQCFKSEHWAYHLGNKPLNAFKIPWRNLDKISIGIEISNWGYLVKGADGKFRNYVNGVVPVEEVCELATAFKGFKYYHAYTDAQIQSTKELLVYLCDKYKISKIYNDDIWDLSKRAFEGVNGIYTHNAIRKDKSDIYPCPKMIAMLKAL